MDIFRATDILLPRMVSYEKWAVIACDQFTSQPAYWARVRQAVGDAPSTVKLILPEVELGEHDEERAEEIAATMADYINRGIFEEYRDCMVYVERTLLSGRVRRGVVGALDLEAYDYRDGSKSPVRASERTVTERIPPRKKVRRNAPLELPHTMLLCNDERQMLIEPLSAQKGEMQKLYDFDLMEGGGRIAGWMMRGEVLDAFEKRLREYVNDTLERCAHLPGAPVVFAVGDGNHSLATAKSCYEEQKQAHGGSCDLASRYSLVELQNIRDEAQQIEPIHRIVWTNEPFELLQRMEREICAENGHKVQWHCGGKTGTVFLSDRKGSLPVGILQDFLDADAQAHPCKIDYIHGKDALRTLSQSEGAIGFELPAIDKGLLFREIVTNGVLPRKTFSMGHAQEKRYYLEARKIR